MPGNNRIRSFLAIELSEPIREAIHRLQDTLNPLIFGARWTKPENIHLTLRFLGNVTPGTIDKIGNAMQKWGGESKPYALKPLGLGAFPNSKTPRILWVGFKRIPTEHKKLVTSIERGLASLGFPGAKKPHFPHLTIARFRDARHKENFQQILADFDSFEIPSLNVSGFTLFKSRLTPDGPKYSVIKNITLE